jgi:hypothetical protein
LTSHLILMILLGLPKNNLIFLKGFGIYPLIMALLQI